MKTLRLAVDRTFAAPFGERSPTLPGPDYTADMLQCTTESLAWPERIDYLVVERIARDTRNECIATLLGRARKALANRFASRPR